MVKFLSFNGLYIFIEPVMVGFLSDTVELDWGFWITGAIGVVGAIIVGMENKLLSN
jgi:hypothetical protein